jgi:hypothetical protein
MPLLAGLANFAPCKPEAMALDIQTPIPVVDGSTINREIFKGVLCPPETRGVEVFMETVSRLFQVDHGFLPGDHGRY